jgi:hypothetical protein
MGLQNLQNQEEGLQKSQKQESLEGVPEVTKTGGRALKLTESGGGAPEVK